MLSTADPRTGAAVVALQAEELAVSRRRIEGDTIRIEAVTRVMEQRVDEPLIHERVEIERIPIDRPIEAVPEPRQEGDTTILPVVEEVIVVHRQLLLKEEVHVRRVRISERHQETVRLRAQDAIVTRVEPGVDTAAGHTVSEPRSD